MFLEKNRQRASVAIRGSDVLLRARRVITPSSGIVRVKFPSRKNGRMMFAEGLLEAHAFYWLEAAIDVMEYREQPFTIRFPDGARLRRYTPDIEVTLHSGQRFVVEIKPQSSLQRADVSAKIAIVREYFIQRNTTYQVWTDSVIRREPWLSNLRWLYSKVRNHLPSIVQKQVALSLLGPHLPIRLGQAEIILKHAGLEPYSLIYDGLLTIDYTKPVSLESELKKHINEYDIRITSSGLSEHPNKKGKSHA